MQQQSKATLFALATVLICSTVASAFKISLQFLQVTQQLFFSSLVSVGVLLVMVAMQGKLGFFKSLGPRDWFFPLVLGFFNPFAYYLFLFQAYDLLPAQEAQPLNYTWAITLSLLSVPLLTLAPSLRLLGCRGFPIYGRCGINRLFIQIHFRIHAVGTPGVTAGPAANTVIANRMFRDITVRGIIHP